MILFTLANLSHKVSISRQFANKFKNNKMEGCFCFLECFDYNQLNNGGNLPFRKNQTMHRAYLPDNEIVFVRNTKNNKINDRFVFSIEGRTLSGFTYEFVKMPLSLAVQRLEQHISSKNTPDEEISEIYITNERISRLDYK
jgi:hypothetical protein